MMQFIWDSLLVSLVISGMTLFISNPAIAVAVLVTNKATQSQSRLIYSNTQAITPVITSETPVLDVSHFNVFQSPPSQLTGAIRLAGSSQYSDEDATSINPKLLQDTDDSVTYSKPTPTAQITSVSQLSDVTPTEWAFQALQSLVERYGCLAGYPNESYRGNRVMTRYEFAAGLNACLNRINQLIAAGSNNLITQADLATLQKLQQDFAPELATVRGRVDALEAQTAKLESQQFSTTTKLLGQVTFAISSLNGGRADGSGKSVNSNVAFSDRVRLYFLTSFTGNDVLLALLQGGNTPNYAGLAGTPQASLSFPQNTGNLLPLNRLEYTFPVNNKLIAYVGAYGAFFEYFVPIFNDVLNNSGNSTISVFGFYNPIYLQGSGTGGGFTYKFIKPLTLSVGYLNGGANDPRTGLTKGPFGALAQLKVSPTKNLDFGLTYVRSFNSLNFPLVGTSNANDPFGGADVSANSYGFEVNSRISRSFQLGGWAGYTQARAESGLNRGANADILNWAVTFVFPDLFKQGNVGGIIIGQEPQVLSNNLGRRFEDPDTSLHLEGFYRFQVTDNLTITPGLLAITNPNGNSHNPTAYISVLRTTFQF